MSAKDRAKSLPHIPGFTVWENANGLGRPGYRPGSGNPYMDTVNALATLDKVGARVIACLVLCVFGAVFGGLSGNDWSGGHGAVFGILLGATGGVLIGYFIGLLLVRLVAVLMVLIPLGLLLWIALHLLVDLWKS